MSEQQKATQELLQRLSLEEIASLLAGKDVWHTVSIPAKGVKALRLSDGPNGVRGIKTFNGSRTTAFPCSVAQGATWNKDLMQSIGVQMAGQAKAKGVSVVLAPTVNLHRSPLSGRAFESFSEDPVLSGVLGAALVRGIQQEGVGACVKHYVCNDQETDRMKVDTIVDERTLRELYLKPFQIVVRTSQPWAVMAAYNRVNGTHVSENKRLLNDVLRGEWGWNGLIMSDWFGVSSSAESLNAGLDLEMPGPSIWRTSDQLLRNIGAGKVTVSSLMARAASVIGLLLRANDAGIEERAEEKEDNSQESRDINRKAAQEAVVLLKNSQHLLPLQEPSSIAIVGPNAMRNVSTGGGSAMIHQYYYVSAYEGIRNALEAASSSTKLTFSQGCFAHEMLPLLETRTSTNDKGFDLEFFAGDFDSPGEVLHKQSTEHAQMIFFDSLPKHVPFPVHGRITSKFTPELQGLHEFSLITTGRAKLYVDGEPVVASWEHQERSEKFFGLAAKEVKGSIHLEIARSYDILVEYSSISSLREGEATALGAGILRIGALAVQDADQVMEDAVTAAQKAEVVLLCVGTDQERESEGYDRVDMRLVGRQNELIERVLAVNPKTVIVNFSGSPIEMPWVEKAQTIVQGWFLGSELGNAVADVVFGRYNPTGKLPLSFPMKLEDNPSFGSFPGADGMVTYTERLNVGYRHYTTKGIETAFPFGHGLSYTKFEYTNLRSDTWTLSPNGKLSFSVDTQNLGKVTGGDVLQIYVSPVQGPVYRPKRELQDFEKVADVSPDEKRTVNFTLDKYAFSYYNDSESLWVMAAGIYNIEVASSSEQVLLQHEVEVVESAKWTGV